MLKSLQEALSVAHQHCSTSEKWDHLREAFQKTTFATFGKKTSKDNDCFDAKSSKMSPIIDTKRAALAEYKLQPPEYRWVKLYSELYSRENTVVASALDAIEPLPIMEELDAEPTLAELRKAIDSLASGKAPGTDVIKCCKDTLHKRYQDRHPLQE
ncbi:uncharacterized protein LOC119585605 [Penaeus monodon]|uniref:uncharacterized protein LOC119585605 n=1 Tax=Penaeus monodon TaxID=6687 RepID=UPI0018A7268D|nr:uncharacterized protein LOC119585605 [Penaeus monodon]